MDAQLVGFAGISLLLAVTPGPDLAVVTKNALAHGRRGVLLTTSGIALALCLHVIASSIGLSALIRTSAQLFTVLKLAGGAYLAYLGLRAFWESRHMPRPPVDERSPAAPTSIFRQGFLSALLNPKLAVFFMTFLPQWVSPDQAVLPRLLLLGLIFATIGYGWMTVYGLAVTRLRAIATAPRVRQWMERATGTVLLGFGARLALERV